MTSHLRNLVLAIPFLCQSATAAVCLRFPGAPVDQIRGEDCRDELAEFERAGRRSKLLQDYDEFLLGQERDPRQAWRRFMKSALKKVWGPEDERLMHEVIKWVGRQAWKKDAALNHQLATLGASREIELRPVRERKTWVEAITSIPGYEDARILVAVTEAEDEALVMNSPLQRRFVVYSSVYRPQAFWIRGVDLPATLSRSAATPWVKGDCLNPEFTESSESRFEIRAYGANKCSTANLARQSAYESRTAFPVPPPPPEIKSENSRWWILAGVLAAGAAAYSMRNKTVVITRGLSF